MRRFLKKLLFVILYSFFLLTFVALVSYFFFYRPFVKELRANRTRLMSKVGSVDQKLVPVKYVKPEVLNMLGKVDSTKKSQFFNFPQTKGEGIVRICSFGDSFVEGGEVDDFYDYPWLLQQLFERQGARNVEVLNYGQGGYGLQQSFMMWDSVARDFDCDYNLLGPRGFQPLRDLTFGAIYRWSPYYLHARYVLDGDDDVKLVEILGDTYAERFEQHFRFVPAWRYWRYTRVAPMFLRSLIPKGRDLKNPFYYDRRGTEEEASDIHRILLKKMAAEGKPVVLGHHKEFIVDRGNSVAEPNLSTALFPEIITFPYTAPGSHAGPWGNQLLARQFLAQLTGQTGGRLAVLKTTDLAWQGATRPRRKIATYSDMRIEIEGVHVADISFLGDGPALNFDAMVSLHDSDKPFLESCLFPLEHELQPGMSVTLRSESSAGTVDYPLGEISVLGDFNVGRVHVEGVEFFSFKELEYLRDHQFPSPLTHGKHRFRGTFFRGNEDIPIEELTRAGTKISVLVDGKRMLIGEVGDMAGTPGVWFHSTKWWEMCRIFRANQFGLVDIEEMGESGTVDLVADHWEDGLIRAPMALWEKAFIDVPKPRDPVEKPLRFAADGSAVIGSAEIGHGGSR